MVTEIEVEEAQRLIEEGAQVVEVLPAQEFEDEHLLGAINSRSRRSMQRRLGSLIATDRSSCTAGTTSET